MVSSEQGDDVQRMQLPTDPVLRIALINRGVLDPEDLVNAQRMLEASGVFVVEPG